MRRYELTDEQWPLIEDLMPQDGGEGGRPWRDHRVVLNGIFWILHTGAQWREMPQCYGKWKTVYNRFARWRVEGLFDVILHRLQLRLDGEGRVDWDLWCVDGTNIRASRAAVGLRKGGGKRMSLPITHWAARVEAGAQSSIWLLTARAYPWPSARRPVSATRARASNQ